MKLHRLELTNFRGVAHREINFPDDGVVIVSGPNEIGKSSMFEALDLLLEFKDRSAHKSIKQVKPTGADVGAEVTAEISTGPYRFVYHKRFHKKPETNLTVLEPHREQLTGDPAHERVRAMFDETVDTGLFRAQRVLQAEATAAVDLSGCDALARALDAAAGEAATLTGAETLLVDRIEEEYARYFTKTGRATGDWAAAVAGLAEAQREVERWRVAVAEVEGKASLHGELSGRLAELDGRSGETEQRLSEARAAAAKLDTLTRDLRDAELRQANANSARTASVAAHAERVRLCEEVVTRTSALADLQPEVAAANDAAQKGAAEQASAEDALTGSTASLATARQREETARRIVEQLVAVDEADSLAGRLRRIDDAIGDRDGIAAELNRITLTEAMLADIERTSTAVDLAGAQLAAISATVEVTAAAEVSVLADTQPVTLAAGEVWSAAAPTVVEVPGMLTVRVSSGQVATKAQANHAAAQQRLADALRVAGVTDLAVAREVDQRRRELQSDHDQVSATLAALCGDDEPARLRDRLTQLRAAQPATDELAGMDLAAARLERDAATGNLVEVEKACEGARAAASAAAKAAAAATTGATVLHNKSESARAELATATERLAVARGSATDEDLAAAVVRDEDAAQRVALEVTGLTERRDAACPDVVATELDDATAAAEALAQQHSHVERELDRVATELGVLGREGRQSKLDAAEAAQEHADADYAAIGRRARAVELLRSVMLRHRDDTRRRYVEPFRTEIERLGRTVFGPTFTVEIDSQLRIDNRTLDDCTVPYESLSGGAKEQLGILTRLAGAALVAKEDTVPVLIDDALGFTDPGRLAGMGAVFDEVGASGQVIVLTCSPDRYQSVEAAHRIELDG